jgi:hypothetical protein
MLHWPESADMRLVVGPIDCPVLECNPSQLSDAAFYYYKHNFKLLQKLLSNQSSSIVIGLLRTYVEQKSYRSVAAHKGFLEAHFITPHRGGGCNIAINVATHEIHEAARDKVIAHTEYVSVMTDKQVEYLKKIIPKADTSVERDILIKNAQIELGGLSSAWNPGVATSQTKKKFRSHRQDPVSSQKMNTATNEGQLGANQPRSGKTIKFEKKNAQFAQDRETARVIRWNRAQARKEQSVQLSSKVVDQINALPVAPVSEPSKHRRFLPHHLTQEERRHWDAQEHMHDFMLLIKTFEKNVPVLEWEAPAAKGMLSPQERWSLYLNRYNLVKDDYESQDDKFFLDQKIADEMWDSSPKAAINGNNGEATNGDDVYFFQMAVSRFAIEPTLANARRALKLYSDHLIKGDPFPEEFAFLTNGAVMLLSSGTDADHEILEDVQDTHYHRWPKAQFPHLYDDLFPKWYMNAIRVLEDPISCDSWSTNPRMSREASSHGEVTEGDDVGGRKNKKNHEANAHNRGPNRPEQARDALIAGAIAAAVPPHALPPVAPAPPPPYVPRVFPTQSAVNYEKEIWFEGTNEDHDNQVGVLVRPTTYPIRWLQGRQMRDDYLHEFHNHFNEKVQVYAVDPALAIYIAGHEESYSCKRMIQIKLHAIWRTVSFFLGLVISLCTAAQTLAIGFAFFSDCSHFTIDPITLAFCSLRRSTFEPKDAFESGMTIFSALFGYTIMYLFIRLLCVMYQEWGKNYVYFRRTPCQFSHLVKASLSELEAENVIALMPNGDHQDVRPAVDRCIAVASQPSYHELRTQVVSTRLILTREMNQANKATFFMTCLSTLIGAAMTAEDKYLLQVTYHHPEVTKCCMATYLGNRIATTGTQEDAQLTRRRCGQCRSVNHAPGCSPDERVYEKLRLIELASSRAANMSASF